MRRPPSVVSSTLPRGSRVMSISRDGRTTFSFIRSIRFVPPAMNFAAGSAAIWRTASTTSTGRVYSKLFTASPRRGVAEHDLFDGCHDVGIRAAPANIATHEFADVIGAAGLALGDQAGGGTNLARGAVAALESIVLDKGLLQRMQRASSRQALDRRHLRAVLHHRQAEP